MTKVASARAAAEHALEMAGEMALIEEAARSGDIGNARAGAQRGERALQAQLGAPCVGRHAGYACEEPRRMEWRESGGLRNVVERHGFG